MPTETKNLGKDLSGLKIDRGQRRDPEKPSRWATRWIMSGIVFFVVLGIAVMAFRLTNKATEVETFRVVVKTAGTPDDPGVILNAAGYIVAHHKIQVTPKVMGKVDWIGVEKGDQVKAGQVIVRFEDAEYQAQYEQAKGSLATLLAQLS